MWMPSKPASFARRAALRMESMTSRISSSVAALAVFFVWGFCLTEGAIGSPPSVVGQLRRVEYAEDADSDQIRVTLKIVREEARRIRLDSVAKISPKGMLGDKLVTITVGSVDQQRLPAGATIKSVLSRDLIGPS